MAGMTMTDREAEMNGSGSICELIETRAERMPAEAPQRKPLHWSDVLVAALALSMLVAVSLHVSAGAPRADPLPVMLRWIQQS